MATIARRIGPLGVDLSAESAEVLVRFGELLAPFAPRPADASVDLRIEVAGGGTDELDVVVNGERRLSGAPLWAVEDRLLSNFNGWLLAREPDRIHLHGALVSRDGVGVLLVGSSGSGKSTLTAHLVRHGWTYHTDETAASVPGTRSWGSYPRPITLKRGSWARFADLPSVAHAARSGAHADRERAHVPVEELGGVASIDPVAVGVVAFVDHRLSGGAADVAPIEAVTRLVAETLDLERAAVPGFADLVRLARGARCLVVPSGDPAAADELLEAARARAAAGGEFEGGEGGEGGGGGEGAVAGSPGLRPTAGSHDPPVAPASVTGASVVVPRADVHGWELPGGGVVHDFRSGVTVELDGSGMAVWTSLDGVRSLAHVARALGAPDDDGDVVAFARHLAELGLLVARP